MAGWSCYQRTDAAGGGQRCMRIDPFEIATAALPVAIIGAPYRATLEIRGGVRGGSFALGAHPDWLSVDPQTGVLSGIPVRPRQEVQVEVVARDGSYAGASQPLERQRTFLLKIEYCAQSLPGQCSSHGTCSINECLCELGYDGQQCEECDSGYHREGGLCVPGWCKPGTHEEQGVCEKDRVCLPSTCAMHGSCDDASGATVCTCSAGYLGANCDNCDQAAGYHWNSDRTVCTEDPCDPSPCAEAHKSQCALKDGKAVCGCDPGFASNPGGVCVRYEYRCASDACGADALRRECTDDFCEAFEVAHDCGQNQVCWADATGAGCLDCEHCPGGGCCQCSSGPCCDGCGFYTALDQKVCDELIEYRCTGTGCGASAERRMQRRFCEGGTAACTGAISGEWASLEDCTGNQLCIATASGAGCEDCAIGCGPRGCCECNGGPCCDGCYFKADWLSCDDLNSCTHSDHCEAGGCVGTAYTCEADLNPCTDEVCLGDGRCAHVDNSAGCDDGLFCNGADRCESGACVHSGDPCGVFSECREAWEACEPLGIATGYDHTCAIATFGRAFCWGSDENGQLGNGVNPDSEQVNSELPVLVGGAAFTALAAGLFHTCGLGTDGRAYCWGLDLEGALGNGNSDEGLSICIGFYCSESPLLVDLSGSPEVRFRALAAGDQHTCGLDTDGRAFCWGYNGHGELGHGDASGSSEQSPVLVDVSGIVPLISFQALTAGGAHTCGVATDGRAFCWGRDSHGQLGRGHASENQSSPVPVLVDVNGIVPPVAFKEITAGYSHTCGVATDGRAFCWGRFGDGRLGIGDIAPSACEGEPCSKQPVAVGGLGIDPEARIEAIAAGSAHTCGLATDGRAFCWGRGESGQLGNGDSSRNAYNPVQVVANGIGFSWLATGGSHTCGISTDGRAFCWGDDACGQLGNGDGLGSAQSPVLVDVSGMIP